MTGPAECAKRLIDAYNRQDFEGLRALIVEDLDFAHFNRGFALNKRDELIATLEAFVSDYMTERHFEPAERITEHGDMVVLESWYVGTTKVDLPGFGAAGESFRLKFCSVMRFNDEGLLVEWKDYG
ncbi:nuclear transport factor 2 family protein [Aurantiacibacter xanthus]|uniref:Nuclear transport factor 2 family protein n=1 Tax=Aurantiacibacter xanthus TaxID=1784712 RepID=A0A3A1P0A7_9SPHN|nr:nuclear transport factor 2 family protein [Aurantiacibacter xanthus]RIV81961.1 nuclear transport factor 2 family protein [Aurantiacibacter xanthus]